MGEIPQEGEGGMLEAVGDPQLEDWPPFVVFDIIIDILLFMEKVISEVITPQR